MEIIRKTRIEGVLPERVDFNYIELKNELDNKLMMYRGKEKTNASNYKERKADRARLNDLARSLNDDRKQLKQQLLAPITNGSPDDPSYSDKIDNLIGAIKMVVGEIDNGIKEYEESEKLKKRDNIINYFASHWKDTFSQSPYVSCFNSSHWQNFAEEQMNRKRNAWLNATCDDEFIRGEIHAEISRCAQAYKLIEATYKDEDELTKTKAFDALAEKFNTADSIEVVNAHKEQIKRIEEREKAIKEAQEAEMVNKVNLQEPIGPSGAKPKIYSCTMKFVGSADAFKNLKEYLDINNNITYKVVEHMTEIQQ